MITKIIDDVDIKDAAKCLKNGGTVVFPTETVYGLGADCFNDVAIDKIYKAKGRPSDNPLIVHISKISDLDKLVSEISNNAGLLIDKFWPGPLTLIFKKRPEVSSKLTGGLDTVAVRFPSDKTANLLISTSGVLVAAPSANLSGSPSPTKCEDVITDLNGRVDYIINSDPCIIGLESTVIDVSGDDALILRPGAVTLEMVRELIPHAKLDNGLIDENSIPKCPGLKYKHYSPKAKLIVIQGSRDMVREYILSMLNSQTNIGILSYGKPITGNNYKNNIIHVGSDMEQYAHNLFSALRDFDKMGVDTIYAEFQVENGIGVAVRNRIYKAAAHNIIEV